MLRRPSLLPLLVLLLVPPSRGHGDTRQEPADLADLSLDELLQIEVYSVSRSSEPIGDAPAAVYVIDREAIRRSGVTSLPDALRLVPGMEVARIDANKWAVTARGSNSRFGNKLLVLIDGRTVYTPVFSGVYWDMHDISLEDIERIEVIRGPGASLWGANAVNGIVNILTAPASHTQGGAIAVAGGTKERGLLSARYGGHLGEGADYRLSLRYFDHGRFRRQGGGEAFDAWTNLRGAARLDWQATDRDAATLHLGLLDGNLEQTATPVTTLDPPATELRMTETPVSAGYIAARWERSLGRGDRAVLQAYYDWYERREVALDEVVRTADVDFQHCLQRGRHEITWGLGYRRIGDEVRGGATLWFSPATRTYDLLSAFAQDRLDLGTHLELTLGAKFEDNDFSGLEVQPTVRALWKPAPRHSLWAALSRAVRTPSRADADLEFRGGARSFFQALPVDLGDAVVGVSGSDAFAPEELVAIEAGYRALPAPSVRLDVAAYYHLYDNLRTVRPVGFRTEAEPPPEHTVFGLVAANEMDGTARGLEVAADWQVVAPWRLRLAWRWQRLDTRSIMAFNVGQVEGQSPQQQLSLRSLADVSPHLELDASLRYVGALRQLDIDPYLNASLRLGWHPSQKLEVYLAGHDLLESGHLEFRAENLAVAPIEVERHLHAGMRWQF